MVKLDHVFISPYDFIYLFVFQFFCPKNIFFESFTWGIIHMGFVGCPFKTSKLENDINFC
jgi:hypothetical protein